MKKTVTTILALLIAVLLGNVFTNWHFNALLSELNMQTVDVIIVLVSLFMMALLDRWFIQDWPMRSPKGGLLARGEIAALLVMCIVCAWILLLAGDGAAAFIYFQF